MAVVSQKPIPEMPTKHDVQLDDEVKSLSFNVPSPTSLPITVKTSPSTTTPVQRALPELELVDEPNLDPHDILRGAEICPFGAITVEHLGHRLYLAKDPVTGLKWTKTMPTTMQSWVLTQYPAAHGLPRMLQTPGGPRLLLYTQTCTRFPIANIQ